MTPKQKAQELIEVFWTNVRDYRLAHPAMTKEQAKQCAFIAVYEILNIMLSTKEDKYWREVKQELEKL